jgi:N-acetylmuramoyl-L-alanine amidase
LIGAIFVAVMVYLSIDMMTKTTPPWKRKKKSADSLAVGFTDNNTFGDTTIYVYKVQKNEVISSIADKFYCKTDSIRKWNELATDKLKENQSLIIKIRAIHKVQKNEFLERIAQKYAVDMKSILKANNIKKADQIRADQKLIIPKPK